MIWSDKQVQMVAGSVREVDRLEDAVSQAEAARLSAEASLAHSSAVQQGEVRSAQQALQAANKDLQDCQARLADLEATNTMLIQEQQVLLPTWCHHHMCSCGDEQIWCSSPHA